MFLVYHDSICLFVLIIGTNMWQLKIKRDHKIILKQLPNPKNEKTVLEKFDKWLCGQYWSETTNCKWQPFKDGWVILKP